MATVERLYDRGTALGRRRLREVADEFKHARLRLGLSQREVAAAARIDRALCSRIEAGRVGYLSIVIATRVASVLGLDLSVRVYPGGSSIRDAGQTTRLAKVRECVGRPLRYRNEVPLPRPDHRFEQRAWDMVIYGHGERTCLEFEARLYDLQAQQRRWNLKLRDDPPDHLLVVVADTPANRRVLAAHLDQLGDLPRLRTAAVLGTLRAGRHPPTGLILINAPLRRGSRGSRG